MVESQTVSNNIKVTVDAGESKNYVARAYKLNKQGTKIFSGYSNEVVITNSNN